MGSAEQAYSETDDVRRALVADMALTAVPSSILGATLIGIGSYSYLATGSTLVLITTAAGGLSSAAKLGVLMAHGRRERQGLVSHLEVRRWETAHAVVTLAIALSIGIMTATLIRLSDLPLHMLATGLLFGYCSGIVGRIGIRPRIAVPALVVAAVPAIIASGLWHDHPHRIIGLIFAIFLFGSFESVRHVHRTAVRHVGTRLDMARIARHDPLTRLANRLGLQHAFQMNATAGTGIAVHCLDLDGFKGVNDRFGHAFGDALLVAVADRLRALMPAPLTLARTGGDEFVILQQVTHDRDADALAHRVDRHLRRPFRVAGHTVQLGSSLGYATDMGRIASLEDLLARADAASYRIKRAGGGVAAETTTPKEPPLRTVA